MRQLYLSLIGSLLVIFSFAQQATTSSSGTGQAGNIIFDWSVGELTLVNTVQNGGLVFTQGLLQGRLVRADYSGSIGNGELVITPNPTRGPLTLYTGFLETGTLSLRLFDDKGSLLVAREEAVTAFGTKTMDLTLYADGIYMLQATFKPSSGKPRQRTYKIMHLQ